MYPFTNYSEDIELATKAGRAQRDDPDLACIIFCDAYNAVPGGIVPPAAALPMLRRIGTYRNCTETYEALKVYMQFSTRF